MYLTKKEAIEHLTSIKVLVKSSEESKIVQRKLFECGFIWMNEGATIQKATPLLFTRKDNIIGSFLYLEDFEKSTATLLTVDDIENIMIVNPSKYIIGDSVWCKAKDFSGNVVDIKNVGLNYIYTVRDKDGYMMHFTESELMSDNNINKSLDKPSIKEEPLQNNNYKPYDKVIVRNKETEAWTATLFSHSIKKENKTYYVNINGNSYSQCIPYQNNENIIGKK